MIGAASISSFLGLHSSLVFVLQSLIAGLQASVLFFFFFFLVDFSEHGLHWALATEVGRGWPVDDWTLGRQ